MISCVKKDQEPLTPPSSSTSESSNTTDNMQIQLSHPPVPDLEISKAVMTHAFNEIDMEVVFKSLPAEKIYSICKQQYDTRCFN